MKEKFEKIPSPEGLREAARSREVNSRPAEVAEWRTFLMFLGSWGRPRGTTPAIGWNSWNEQRLAAIRILKEEFQKFEIIYQWEGQRSRKTAHKFWWQIVPARVTRVIPLMDRGHPRRWTVEEVWRRFRSKSSGFERATVGDSVKIQILEGFQ